MNLMAIGILITGFFWANPLPSPPTLPPTLPSLSDSAVVTPQTETQKSVLFLSELERQWRIKRALTTSA